VTDAVFDVHLMINEPIRYIDDYVEAGVDVIVAGSAVFKAENSSQVIKALCEL